MKIKWQDINYTEEPGRYPFRDGFVRVEMRHIREWKEHPNDPFTVISTGRISEPGSSSAPIPEYVLGGRAEQ
jgi:hypothetical protein